MTSGRNPLNVLVTGGAGFIGSNFIRFLLNAEDFVGRIINVDLLTYAGNLLNLVDINDSLGGSRYFFERADICDRARIERIFLEYEIDTVVHFAAESHVDRSIVRPDAFVHTNILGTYTLLDVARLAWQQRADALFHHVSTDEVYGSLGDSGSFSESTAYDPRSPYAASKASSDHLAMAYHHTYGLPVTLSNCSNNYGPYQFPEKLIPLMILNMMKAKPLPIYGDGKHVRDWLYVDDHSSAVWTIIRTGRTGEKYNIGGESEWENLRLVETLCELVAEKLQKAAADLTGLITFIKDRPGHDRRYSIDCSKIKTELQWRRRVEIMEGLSKTVAWYINNFEWIERVQSGEYLKWIDKNYNLR